MAENRIIQWRGLSGRLSDIHLTADGKVTLCGLKCPPRSRHVVTGGRAICVPCQVKGEGQSRHRAGKPLAEII
jgi:radical SAM superfamily enzyme